MCTSVCLVTVVCGLFVEIYWLFTLFSIVVLWRKIFSQTCFSKNRMTSETQKKIWDPRWEKGVGKGQVVQSNGTGRGGLQYGGQVGLGQGGIHNGWDWMELGQGCLQIKWDSMGLGQGGLFQLNQSTCPKVGLQGRERFNFTEEFEFLDFDSLTKMSLPLRILNCISLTISNLIFSGTGCIEISVRSQALSGIHPHSHCFPWAFTGMHLQPHWAPCAFTGPVRDTPTIQLVSLCVHRDAPTRM